jgi:hypothetical protein
MGADIHTFVEVKSKGKWILFDQPNVDRNYALFGRMAGVRDEEQKPIVDPKGLPKDMSVGTSIAWENWKEDGHTASWFDTSEIAELLKFYDNDRLDFMEDFGWNVLYTEENPLIEDTRVVFWFDN